jgi:oleandomycin transport system permease protein
VRTAPLSFASNIFVKTTSLPGWLQGFVSVNPLTIKGFFSDL